MFVYIITNIVNGKRYVGQTSLTVSGEWASHVRKARSGASQCRRLYRAIRKYGVGAFVVSQVIQVEGDHFALDSAERDWISRLKTTDKSSGYNIKEGGSRGAHSDETRERLRAAALGRTASMETRLKLSVARRRRVITDETRRKTSETLKKYRISDTHRANLSAAMVGHSVSAETRAKIGAANRIHAIARGWQVLP